jgi:predicted negative regulator of RcsB-dependent stress response
VIATKYLKSEYYPQAVYNLAKIDAKNKQYASAASYVEALKGTKYYYDGLMLLAELAYDTQNFDTAAGLYKRIAEESSDAKVLYKQLLTLMKN